jgi:calcium-dependent protein kinase
VKILKKDSSPSHIQQKLRNEITIVKQLDHPNIIKFFEIFEETKRILIVQEKCKGEELFEVLLKKKNFSESQACFIIKEIFSVLAYLHDKGFVHRDLKPENVLIEDNSEGVSVKVVNFLSAARIFNDSALSGLVGTAYYVAPEVIQGLYGEKCDLWSAGVILFMLLSGYPPFDGHSDKDILEKVLLSKPNYSEMSWSGVSEEAKDLLCKLLCPEPVRLSATQALKHPWILKFSNTNNRNSLSVVHAFENLKNFHKCNKLRDAVQTFIATQCISSQEAKDLTEAFKLIDTNGDGKLSREELLSHYKSLMFSMHPESEIDQIMQEVDSDENGFINYTEFLKASISQKVLISSQNLRRAFDIFDNDQSGSITANELKRVLQSDNNLDEKIWKDIIKCFDQNSDGEIDLREFEEIITKNF